MAIDQKRLGEHIAAQMEAIEGDYSETDAEIGTIITIVEVLGPNGVADVRMRPSDPRPHVILGMLRWAEMWTERAARGPGDGT